MTRPTPDTHSAVTTTAELRIPTQLRGARRVESILDAAAELVIEHGVEGVTAQALADRANTSKGSLYHFFPDVPSVLRALGDRHLTQINTVLGGIVRDEAIEWRTLPTKDVVSRLLAPLDYLEHNCDLLALVRAPGVLPRTTRAMQPMVEFVENVLHARFPHMNANSRSMRAAMIVAVIDGVVATATRGCSINATSLRHELEGLLSSYLDSLD